MRSNIDRTWEEKSPESREGCVKRLLEGGEEADQVVELLVRKGRVGGHDPRRVDQRARDRRPRDPCSDVGQLGTGAAVAVVPQLVAGQAAEPRRNVLAG